MRRVVFDCDRCGKRDLPEVFGLYSLEGEAPEYRLSQEQEADLTQRVGYVSEELTRLTFVVLEEVEKTRHWEHLCKTCFRKITDNVAGILGDVKPKAAPKKPKPPKPRPEPPEEQTAPLPAEVVEPMETHEPTTELTPPPPAEKVVPPAEPPRKAKGRSSEPKKPLPFNGK